jgi:integrase
LPLDDIERVIDSCDLTTRIGIRDRAILLLLARLALRGNDVVNLRLSDIDWRHAQLQVCGKSKRAVRLPLPQEVGDALLDYIEHARPRVDEDKVFLRALPPYRPPGKISHVVSLALQRAGVDSPSGRGAHLIRHSAATGLVRSGASLESIGALLRHRSPNSTAIYAKVNVPMLQEVAQPWIGELG